MSGYHRDSLMARLMRREAYDDIDMFVGPIF